MPRFNARDVRSVVWDYRNGTFHTPNTPFDVFCAGQTLLADGKVLVAGGTDQYDPFISSPAAYLFDPILEEWLRAGDMAAGRWYPSLITLGDSRAVAAWAATPRPARSPSTATTRPAIRRTSTTHWLEVAPAGPITG